MNFTIKEIAERAGIAAHVLRYYEKEGSFPPRSGPGTASANTRRRTSTG